MLPWREWYTDRRGAVRGKSTADTATSSAVAAFECMHDQCDPIGRPIDIITDIGQIRVINYVVATKDVDTGGVRIPVSVHTQNKVVDVESSHPCKVQAAMRVDVKKMPTMPYVR